jgi:hypothetical protein
VIITDWVEHLRCPECGKTGDAELFEISPFNNGVRRIADGFKVVAVQYGKDFHCETCDIRAVPTHKVAALQPAARGQEPRDRKPAERKA